MSACFLPYSKKLLRCECHLVPSHCHDCEAELPTLISSCFFLLLNFLGIHRGFKLLKCNCLLVLCCQTSALEVFSFMPSLEFFSLQFVTGCPIEGLLSLNVLYPVRYKFELSRTPFVRAFYKTLPNHVLKARKTSSHVFMST